MSVSNTQPSLYKKVLVAIDFSESSLQAVIKAKQMADSFGADVEIIHVVEIPTYPILEDIAVMGMPGIWDEEVAQSLTAASNVKLSQMAKEYGIHRFHTVAGIADMDIVEYAKQKNHDLIVMGSHGLSGLQKLIGSTTHSVINNADCDVLAVKAKEKG